MMKRIGGVEQGQLTHQSPVTWQLHPRTRGHKGLALLTKRTFCTQGGRAGATLRTTDYARLLSTPFLFLPSVHTAQTAQQRFFTSAWMTLWGEDSAVQLSHAVG